MIYVGFTRAAGGSWISQEIDRKSGGRGWCHAFTYFADLDLVHEAHAQFGVRFVDRDVDKAREVIVEYPSLTPARERMMLAQAAVLAGNGYDFCAVTHFELPWVKEDRDKQMCSEAAVMIGKAGGYFPGAIASETSPNGLYVLCQQQGFTFPD